VSIFLYKKKKREDAEEEAMAWEAREWRRAEIERQKRGIPPNPEEELEEANRMKEAWQAPPPKAKPPKPEEKKEEGEEDEYEEEEEEETEYEYEQEDERDHQRQWENAERQHYHPEAFDARSQYR